MRSRHTSRGPAGGLAGLWAACLAGCGETGVQPCLDLVHAGRYEKAARRCAASYTASHGPRAGAAVVYAEYSLGHEGEVLAWVDRLAQTGRVRAGVWSLAAAGDGGGRVCIPPDLIGECPTQIPLPPRPPVLPPDLASHFLFPAQPSASGGGNGAL